MASPLKSGLAACTFLCKNAPDYRRTLKGICRDFRLGLIRQFEAISHRFKNICSENYLPEVLYNRSIPSAVRTVSGGEAGGLPLNC